VFVEEVTGRHEEACPKRTKSEGNATMNQPVIEAQARYLIEDRVHAQHRRQSIHDRRRHRRLRTLIWL
jgi:hypothetical protein